jgi:NAD(P)-dependent dehydrogenase (short-subunit alcohol dehydrogenase family)
VNKVLLVTGAGRGIGAATARLAAAEGYAVCVNYARNESTAYRLVDEITGAGGRAVAVQADVSIEADVVRLFQRVDAELGPLAGLVNNAGILDRQARLEDLDAERINRVLAVNVTGSFLCAREAVRRMSARHGGAGGAIVNVSSGAARLGSANLYIDYAASKGAVDTLTVGLAKEVIAEGIRVNAVRPGTIDTDIHAGTGDPRRVERVQEKHPMRRTGQPEEVARAILWLLSDQASYTAGAILDIDGGR